MSQETALRAELDRLKLELDSLKASNKSEEILIGNYLLARLAQLNVTVSLQIISYFFSYPVVYVWGSWRFQSWIFGERM